MKAIAAPTVLARLDTRPPLPRPTQPVSGEDHAAAGGQKTIGRAAKKPSLARTGMRQTAPSAGSPAR
jgi:hypothetical protein